MTVAFLIIHFPRHPTYRWLRTCESRPRAWQSVYRRCCIGFRSLAIAIFIFKARKRTEDLLRSICSAISAKLAPDNASSRNLWSSASDHREKVTYFSPSRPRLDQAADCFQSMSKTVGDLPPHALQAIPELAIVIAVIPEIRIVKVIRNATKIRISFALRLQPELYELETR